MPKLRTGTDWSKLTRVTCTCLNQSLQPEGWSVLIGLDGVTCPSLGKSFTKACGLREVKHELAWKVKCNKCPLQSIMRPNLWLDQKCPIPMTHIPCLGFMHSLSREYSHLLMLNASYLSASRLHMATASPESDRFTKMIPRGEFFIH